MMAWSCGLTSAVGTAISLAGTSRMPPSSAKTAVGTATPNARTARCHLKLVLTGRLLLMVRVFWVNPILKGSVANFRVVRNSVCREILRMHGAALRIRARRRSFYGPCRSQAAGASRDRGRDKGNEDGGSMRNLFVAILLAGTVAGIGVANATDG